jgi:hypothetical protein
MKSPVPRLILLCLVGAILGQDRPADRPWPKVHPDLARVLAGSKNPDSRLKVWVAFRDKGFAGEAELAWGRAASAGGPRSWERKPSSISRTSLWPAPTPRPSGQK